MLQRKTPLRRKSFLRSAAKTSERKPRTSGLRRVSERRAAELRLYYAARKRYLAEHPVCEVWCRERHWQRLGRVLGDEVMYDQSYASEGATSYLTYSASQLLALGAPAATEVHHMNKRRGKMLLDENFWLAVCRKNHERIEGDKKWARLSGFLLNF